MSFIAGAGLAAAALFVLFVAFELGRERGYHEGWDAHQWHRAWVDRLRADMETVAGFAAEIEAWEEVERGS